MHATTVLITVGTGWSARRTETLRPETVEDDHRLLGQHVLPDLGSVKRTDLSPAMLQRWADRMGLRRVAERARTLLRTALQDAVRLGMLPANPVDRVRPPKVERR